MDRALFDKMALANAMMTGRGDVMLGANEIKFGDGHTRVGEMPILSGGGLVSSSDRVVAARANQGQILLEHEWRGRRGHPR
jgi:hypothetical protein